MPTELRLYNIAELYNMFKEGTLVIQQEFQRPYVWSTKAQALLIDTILKNLPMPLLLIRRRLDVKKGTILLEVVDGQQRLRTIFGFIQNRLKIPVYQDSGSGTTVTFEHLSAELKQRFLYYSIPVSVLVGVTDREVLNIFSRLNQYSVILSPQEVLDARFPGAFSQTVSQLALEHLQFWKKNAIFSEKLIARKKDAELVAQLVVAMVAGLQDGKKRLPFFYERFNDDFPMAETIIREFRSTIDLIAFVFQDELADTIFRKTSLFYSLFCVFVDCKYGLPKIGMGRIPINDKTKTSILKSLKILSENMRGRWRDSGQEAFFLATMSASNSLRHRRVRHEYIWNVLNSAVEERGV